MIGRLVRWFGFGRPTVYGPPVVVDMDTVIAELDPGVSQFSTMLMNLRRGFEETIDWMGNDRNGLWTVWEWQEISPQAAAALESFGQRRYTDSGYVKPEPSFSWHEDEFMPRLAAA